jgi:hypothetical protein
LQPIREKYPNRFIFFNKNSQKFKKKSIIYFPKALIEFKIFDVIRNQIEVQPYSIGKNEKVN